MVLQYQCRWSHTEWNDSKMKFIRGPCVVKRHLKELGCQSCEAYSSNISVLTSRFHPTLTPPLPPPLRWIAETQTYASSKRTVKAPFIALSLARQTSEHSGRNDQRTCYKRDELRNQVKKMEGIENGTLAIISTRLYFSVNIRHIRSSYACT